MSPASDFGDNDTAELAKYFSPGLEWRAIYALLDEVEVCHEQIEANGLQDGLQQTVYALMAEVDRLHQLLESAGISWIEQ